MADTLDAETVTAREANQRFSRLLGEVAAGKSFVITRHGVPVARLAPEPAPDGRRRLTLEQRRALDESEAFFRSLKPRPAPPDLPPGWPRDRDELYDDMMAEPSPPWPDPLEK